MPNPSTDFLINIRTALEAQGIKMTDAEFSKLNETVKSSNTAVAELGTELDKTGKRGEEAHEKIHEGAHKSELDHRELRESVSAVAAQFGGLADVGLWLSPMTAALAIVLAAVERFKEVINQANEASERLAETTNAINNAGIKAFADASRSAAEAMQSLDIEQTKLNATYASGDAAMQNRIKQYGEEKDALLKVEEAKEQAFEAEIHRQVTLGQISKERGDAVISQAKLQLEAQQGANDQAKLAEEIQERQKQLAQAQRNLEGADQAAIRTAHAKEEPLAADSARSKEAASQAEKGAIDVYYGGQNEHYQNREGLQASIGKVKDTIEGNEELGQPEEALKPFREQLQTYQDALKAHDAYVENLNRDADIRKSKLTEAQARTEQANDQFRRDREINRTGTDEIDALQSKYERQAKTNAAVQAQHQATANTNAQTEAIEQRQRVQSGHGTPAEQRARAEQDAINATARERGPQANIDASQTLTKTELLESTLRGMPRSDQTQHMGEMNRLLDLMLGYLENGSVTPAMHNALAGKVNGLETMLHDLQSQSNNSRMY
ncbi:MAG TPA: hypothetical protein VH595_01325 [Verrucomicrobiae bacterium]|jgi:hypothetical protein|nr:hypothetical protein [Verrucomicrobiae bacterium]